MEDNELRKIEDFLKVQGNTKMKFLQRFEEEVDKLIKNDFDLSSDSINGDFIELITATNTALEEFSKEKEEVVKSFGISLVLIKNLLKSIEEGSSLKGTEKNVHLTLVGYLKESLEKECNDVLDYFKVFLDYINTNIFSTISKD